MAFRDSFEPPAGGGGGVSDHGALSGLADDDHQQYAPAEGPARTLTDARIGDRTVDPALVGTANTGPLTSLLSWLTGSVKGITGEVDWKNVPVTTLKTLKTRADAHEGSRDGHPLATAVLDGLMAGPDKSKLDGLGGITRVERRANQATGISNGWYTVSWDTEVSDTAGWFDPANPTRLTPSAGKYVVVGISTWSSNTAGIRAARVQKTTGGVASDVVNGQVLSAAVDQYGRVPFAGIVEIATGEYLTADFFHSSGAAIVIGRNAVVGLPDPFLAIAKIG